MHGFIQTIFHHMWARGIRFSGHLEHLAVAAYSFTEVFGMHHAIWYVSLSLIFIGLGGFIYETFRKG